MIFFFLLFIDSVVWDIFPTKVVNIIDVIELRLVHTMGQHYCITSSFGKKDEGINFDWNLEEREREREK